MKLYNKVKNPIREDTSDSAKVSRPEIETWTRGAQSSFSLFCEIIIYILNERFFNQNYDIYSRGK